MKLTLRKANALQNAIQDHLKTIDVATSISLNEFQNHGVELNQARNQLVANDQRRADLTMALYAIRGQVGRANAACGVSDQLARAAYIDRRIGHLKGLAESSAVESDMVIGGKLDKIRNDKGERGAFYGRTDTVTTGVLTQEQIDQYKADMSALKKEKQTINDRVLELNIRTEIELIDDVCNILVREQLI